MDILPKNIEKIARTRLCANTPAQHAVCEAFKSPRNYTKEMVNKLRKRRDYSLKRINELDMITTVKPDGAFYIFPKIETDLPKLLEALTAVNFCCWIQFVSFFMKIYTPPFVQLPTII